MPAPVPAPVLAMVLAAALWAAAAAPSGAQQPADGGGGGQPIEVTADRSIELHEEQRAYVARGRARAVRGDGAIDADVLIAYYRDLEGGGTEVYRLVAEGNVVVTTPSRRITGQRGVYDVDMEVAVMTGGDLRLVAGEDVVTASESLEFWDRENLAVARGDALVVRGPNRVSGDVVVALLREAAGGAEGGAGGGEEIERVDVQGDVVIVTETDVVRGDEAVYDVDRDVATVVGDVRVTRGGNQINGAAAEVDFSTGISRMLPVRPPPQGAAGAQASAPPPGRVRGLFLPGQRPGEGIAPAAPREPGR
jgi:lipopolysaccharide export system protein LptA